MKIIYKNNKVEKQCNNLKEAKKSFGRYGEDVIACKNLLESMGSFSDVMNYPPLHCHKLKGEMKNMWGIDVKSRKCSLRIVIAPLDEKGKKVLADSNFAITCKELKVVLIEEVGNHYE